MTRPVHHSVAAHLLWLVPLSVAAVVVASRWPTLVAAQHRVGTCSLWWLFTAVAVEVGSVVVGAELQHHPLRLVASRTGVLA